MDCKILNTFYQKNKWEAPVLLTLRQFSLVSNRICMQTEEGGTVIGLPVNLTYVVLNVFKVHFFYIYLQCNNHDVHIKKLDYYILFGIMLILIFVLPYWFVTSKTYFPKTFGWAFDLISMIVNKLSALVSILRVMRVFRAPFWSVREMLGCGKDSTKTCPFR